MTSTILLCLLLSTFIKHNLSDPKWVQKVIYINNTTTALGWKDLVVVQVYAIECNVYAMCMPHMQLKNRTVAGFLLETEHYSGEGEDQKVKGKYRLGVTKERGDS